MWHVIRIKHNPADPSCPHLGSMASYVSHISAECQQVGKLTFNTCNLNAQHGTWLVVMVPYFYF